MAAGSGRTAGTTLPGGPFPGAPHGDGPHPGCLPPQFDTPDRLRSPVTDACGTMTYYDIEFGTVHGYRPLRLDLRVPAGSGAAPVVVFLHGGGFSFGSRLHGLMSEAIWRGLLDRGIAVASAEYRLSGEAIFPACLHDAKAAVRWLRKFGAELGVRPNAIGAWGESAGGHLAAFLGLNNAYEPLKGKVGVGDVSSEVQAAVAWYPPTDFLAMDAQAPAGSEMWHGDEDSPESLLIGGALRENREAAAFASPVSHASAAAAPILLVHGLQDRTVPYQQSVVLRDALEAAGAPVRLELIPDAGHVFTGVDIAPIVGLSADFLAAELGRAAGRQ
jgi:acetyl esterase/lipase